MITCQVKYVTDISRTPFSFLPCKINFQQIFLCCNTAVWKIAWLIPVRKKGNRFACSNYRGVVAKLDRLAVGCRQLAWCKSYLTGRKCGVRIQTDLSDTFDGCSGVPQGSDLSPLLFNLFLNYVSLLPSFDSILL